MLSATALASARAVDVVESASADASYVVYVPEPARGLQLLAGWLGLGALGAKRTRRRRGALNMRSVQ